MPEADQPIATPLQSLDSCASLIFVTWRLHLIDWLGVSVGRTIQIAWVFWALLAVSAYFDWGGQKGWTEFLVRLSWLTLIAFAVMLAIRKHELSSDLR